MSAEEKKLTDSSQNKNDDDKKDPIIINENKSNPNSKQPPSQNNQTKLQNNKNHHIKNQNQNKHKNKSKRRKKKNAWNAPKNKSKFENIMNEQQTEQSYNKLIGAQNKTNDPCSMFMMDEESLLEQQMILEAIAQSQKTQQNETKTINNNNDEKKDIDKDEKKMNTEPINNTKPKINDQLLAESINAQSQTKTKNTAMSDELLAIHLQKEEQKQLHRRQKMSEIYNGPYAKVTSSSIAPQNIPKSSLQFYYDDTSMMSGGLTKDEYVKQQKKDEDNKSVKSNSESPTKIKNVAVTKHDAKVWSQKHIHRLNEYETAGDLDQIDMNISNQAYNSFRNQMDKKGYINYYNYTLEPKQRKRR